MRTTIIRRLGSQMLAHGSMQRHHPTAHTESMQSRYVAESDNPLRIPSNIIGQSVQQMNGPISATAAQDRLHSRIVQRMAKIVHSFIYRPRINARMIQTVRRNGHTERPTFQNAGRPFHIIGIDNTRRRNNGNAIAGA